MKTFTSLLMALVLSMSVSFLFAQQRTVTGTVSTTAGAPLPGVNVVVKGSFTGTTSDGSGKYSLSVPDDNAVLVFSFIGYKSTEMAVAGKSTVDVKLAEQSRDISEVVIVGSRTKPRSLTDSPVPVDNISVAELKNSGRNDLDQMITYAAPSFNSTQQTVSDATAHMNPADLRGLGPSRTLVLVNGKRKNQSSLVYINDTPGKGEVGVDLTSIPTSAIERIEVLRDGASAQYGSDAIAGVINIILKDDVEYTDINSGIGMTTESDGETYFFDANFGFKMGERGFMNLTTAYKDQKSTNRPNSNDRDLLFGMEPGNPAGFPQELFDASMAWIKANPDLGMIVGQPQMVTNDVMYNGSYDLEGGAKLYSFGGLTYRKGLSYALFRTPYWVELAGLDPGNIYGGKGFHPDFQTDILDRTFGLGLKGMKSGWDFDLSTVLGSNRVEYNVTNSINPTIGVTSPTEFFAGGYDFSSTVSNFDMSKDLGKVGVAFGTEFRIENFVAFAGEENSYLGSGAQSFPGIQPQNEVDKKRFNYGVYGNIESDLTEAWLVDLAGRYEKYSDFGDNFSGKLSTRYKIPGDKVTIRASVSTGFRAPSLHQLFLSNIQTLISGGTVSDQGTFSSTSPVLRAFDVPKLKEETAMNYGAGLTFQINPQFLVTADYYHINVDDRVVFTGAIGSTGGTSPVIDSILTEFSITSFKFFINGIDTETDGIDLVATYNNIPVGTGKLKVTLAANYNKTEIVGDLKTPGKLASEGNVLFDRKERSRIESSRPQDKVIFGLSYNIKKWNINLNNTRFGEVTWRHSVAPGTTPDPIDPTNTGGAPDRDQTFSAKVITDLSLGYKFNERFKLSVGADNLLDVYPDVIDTKGDYLTDLGGRFKYPWEVNQFGFMGTYVYGKLNIKI